jgi:hypothetical protein
MGLAVTQVAAIGPLASRTDGVKAEREGFGTGFFRNSLPTRCFSRNCFAT